MVPSLSFVSHAAEYEDSDSVIVFGISEVMYSTNAHVGIAWKVQTIKSITILFVEVLSNNERI